MYSNSKIYIFFMICISLNAIDCWIVDPGPLVIATKGEVWPEPQIYNKSEDFLILRPKYFKIKINSSACTILDEAIVRYLKIIENDADLEKRGFNGEIATNIIDTKLWLKDDHFKGYLDNLTIDFNGPCEEKMLPTFDMLEDYKLDINLEESKLTSDSVWGILRGLESFSQMFYLNADFFVLQINLTHIEDFPRFPHRGLLLDTSRHFIPKPYILKTLDAMAFNKLNVFHWHITDDQSFPYQSIKFPELSQKGAYHPIVQIYTQADIAEIIEYARLRGIRVLTEFDTPGHTRSWGEAITGLLTPCYNNSKKTGHYGPIDPTNEKNFDFLKEFFQEIAQVFPDKFIHLGGDEVPFDCWSSNPDIINFMKKKNITDNYPALESYYIQKLINIVDKLNSSSIVWEEVFVNGVTLPKETIVHVWIGNGKDVLNKVTKSGRHALLSSCWYLDHLSTGGDWRKFYECDATDFPGNETQKKLVLGGEACMWAEVVNQYNVISRDRKSVV